MLAGADTSNSRNLVVFFTNTFSMEEMQGKLSEKFFSSALKHIKTVIQYHPLVFKANNT